jgi:hypothetical protein
MDYEAYRKAFFTEPPPETRFDYEGLNGLALYFQEYESAIQYYENVLGPPGYVEGQGVRGWRIGNSWLTLFRSDRGNPQNIEATIVMKSPEEAERLQAEFIKAGGEGEEPSDELMYEPIRMCPVRDPFGTNILIISSLMS